MRRCGAGRDAMARTASHRPARRAPQLRSARRDPSRARRAACMRRRRRSRDRRHRAGDRRSPRGLADRRRAALGRRTGTTPSEDLLREARRTRDIIHPEGAAERFAQRYENRAFRMWTDENGQPRAQFVLDDDGEAWIRAMIDAGLRPRRGGPRFVTDEERTAARALIEDPRSNDQIAYDLLLATLKAGSLATAEQVFGARQPGVRMIVEKDAVARRDAFGRAPRHRSPRGPRRHRRRVRSSTGRSATPAFERSKCVQRAIRSTSAASSGCSRRSRSSPWPSGTADASSHRVRCPRHTPSRITSTTSRETKAEPTSIAAFCSARSTICSCTTTGGRSPATAGADSSFIRRPGWASPFVSIRRLRSCTGLPPEHPGRALRTSRAAQRDGSRTSLPIVRRARRSSCARRACDSGYSPPAITRSEPASTAANSSSMTRGMRPGTVNACGSHIPAIDVECARRLAGATGSRRTSTRHAVERQPSERGESCETAVRHRAASHVQHRVHATSRRSPPGGLR